MSGMRLFLEIMDRCYWMMLCFAGWAVAGVFFIAFQVIWRVCG
jgi:hypothetical protein